MVTVHQRYEDKPKSCAVKDGKTNLFVLNVTEENKYLKPVEQMVEVMQEGDNTEVGLPRLCYWEEIGRFI